MLCCLKLSEPQTPYPTRPPAQIGHQDSVWHSGMNTTLISYQNDTTAAAPPPPQKLVCWTAFRCQERATFYMHCPASLAVFLPFLVLFSFSLSFKDKQKRCQSHCVFLPHTVYSYTCKYRNNTKYKFSTCEHALRYLRGNQLMGISLFSAY